MRCRRCFLPGKDCPVKKLAIVVGCLCALSGLGCSSSSPPSSSPQITLLTRAALPASVTACYDGAASFASDVGAVNNDGVFAGDIQANPAEGSGCLQHAYLWNGGSSRFEVIPFATLPDPTLEVLGERVAVLSTGLVSGGITFVASDNPDQPLEIATFNDHLAPSLIPGTNYVFGVSENSRFITGTNIGEQPLLFDHALGEAYNLTIGGVVLSRAMLVGVSNEGIAVGSRPQESSVFDVAIVCSASTVSCADVVGGEIDGVNALFQSISSNGLFLYGFFEQNAETQLFSVSPTTHEVTALDPGYFIGTLSPATDDGTLVVHDGGPVAFLFVLHPDGSHAIYSVAELADRLALPSNVSVREAYLSPNGKFVAFDVDDFGPDDVFAAKVYFPSGVTSYAITNLTPVTSTGAQPLWP